MQNYLSIYNMKTKERNSITSFCKDNGFAANNVSLGIGSFSMSCLEENGVLKPFTRDSFSVKPYCSAL